MASDPAGPPALIADIGGTNARFALVDSDKRISAERVLSCMDYPDLVQAAAAYLRDTPGLRPRRAAVAVATPITGDWIDLTNNHWSFSREAAQQALGLDQLLILNDFTALALALPLLGPDERRAAVPSPIRRTSRPVPGPCRAKLSGPGPRTSRTAPGR